MKNQSLAANIQNRGDSILPHGTDIEAILAK